MEDPIVEEIRKIRDEHAARFNYDLHAIVADLKKREKEAQNKGRKVVRLARKPVSNGQGSRRSRTTHS